MFKSFIWPIVLISILTNSLQSNAQCLFRVHNTEISPDAEDVFFWPKKGSDNQKEIMEKALTMEPGGSRNFHTDLGFAIDYYYQNQEKCVFFIACHPDLKTKSAHELSPTFKTQANTFNSNWDEYLLVGKKNIDTSIVAQVDARTLIRYLRQRLIAMRSTFDLKVSPSLSSRYTIQFDSLGSYLKERGIETLLRRFDFETEDNHDAFLKRFYRARIEKQLGRYAFEAQRRFEIESVGASYLKRLVDMVFTLKIKHTEMVAQIRELELKSSPKLSNPTIDNMQPFNQIEKSLIERKVTLDGKGLSTFIRTLKRYNSKLANYYDLSSKNSEKSLMQALSGQIKRVNLTIDYLEALIDLSWVNQRQFSRVKLSKYSRG